MTAPEVSRVGEDRADEVRKRGRAYEVVGMPLMQRLERVQWDREPSKGDLARFVTVASEWRYDATADDRAEVEEAHGSALIDLADLRGQVERVRALADEWDEKLRREFVLSDDDPKWTDWHSRELRAALTVPAADQKGANDE